MFFKGDNLFDQKDVSNIGEEFERGLAAYRGTFDRAQIKALRTAFEMAMMNTLVLIEGRLR
ncbi:MAG TPA: hypothetical protein ENK47_06590 [Euryarchaeota archaeon]|nr:MAG: hypothetical protein B6U90_04090 [Thermoplasmatales archaeon ex4484_6]RLF69178.1 MAG: hypothetical protein DRN57_01530 [Thermoplasmata archaeon]HHD16361.1 hypothetical protein [Euryarchaeota archaeon]